MIHPWNQEILDTLTQERDRSTHAWLFCGPAGLGKLDLAMTYATQLLGDTAMFEAGSHPDFHVLIPEHDADPEGDLIQRYGLRHYATPKGKKAKTIISVDQVRTLTAALMTYGYSTYKFVLISPAHQMNINAANALLKVLEEPPSNTVFVLVSDRPDQLPATVRSRCTAVHFRIPPAHMALDWLAERGGDRETLKLALYVAGGAPLLADSMVKTGFLDTRRQIIGDIKTVLARPVDVSAISQQWRDLGVEQALEVVQGMLADLVRSKFHQSPPDLRNPDQRDWLQHAAKVINLNRIFPLMHRIGLYLQDATAPLDKNLVLEDFLLEFCELSDGGSNKSG